MNVGRIAKAVVAFLVPAIYAVTSELEQPSINWRQLGIKATVAILTAAVTWAVPNAKETP